MSQVHHLMAEVRRVDEELSLSNQFIEKVVKGTLVKSGKGGDSYSMEVADAELEHAIAASLNY